VVVNIVLVQSLLLHPLTALKARRLGRCRLALTTGSLQIEKLVFRCGNAMGKQLPSFKAPSGKGTTTSGKKAMESLL